MAVIVMRDVCWGFGSAPLLENVNLQIEKGQRICLLGRNGAGKSSLLKLLCNAIPPDSGDIWRQQGITIAALEQEVPSESDGTIFETIALGFGEKGKLLTGHNRISKPIETETSRNHLQKRDPMPQVMNTDGGLTVLKKTIENALSRTGLDPESRFSDLSAGMKRRAIFARALAQEPDLLLLDEPTNHLDIDAIIWMEEYILRYAKTLLFVSHDRAFLKRIATRIIELDRGRLTSYDCDYDTYLKRREAAFEAEEQQNRVFDKKLSREEVWIRQGVKARRTRNEGRVRALQKLRAEARSRRTKTGNVRLELQQAERSGRLVIEAEEVNHSYGQTPVIRGFSTSIMRGDKVGIIGPNGAGKTTLLSILLKEITPDNGTVRHGTQLQAAYFDQLRAQLDERKTAVQNIGEGNDFIIFNGQRRHVISHLQDFLFPPERCRLPVHVLSGGERNRLLLARLFAKPANLLVLDEPTNDLDAETLELLEELLFDYNGTLLLVSHDRAFLNNVVTSTIVFEGRGIVTEYAGGYDDWLLQRPVSADTRPEKKEAGKVRSPPPPPKAKKLGFNESRELSELPRRIDELESEQKALHAAMSDPFFYKKSKEEMAALQKRLAEVEQAIEANYLRWETLESL
ncbi:MAG: ATP-binding cassette domain-containing protein [Desulfobacteraceae bacterium]|nr:MAG: ATP-binding cassette domain-containing protein [Desulfobacteraceae bacterium]